MLLCEYSQAPFTGIYCDDRDVAGHCISPRLLPDESWLQNFAYRIDIGWQVFVFAGVISIVLAVLTISFHAIKVATGNPINSLRSE